MTKKPTDPEFLNVAEVAQALHVGVKLVRRKIAAGEIPHHRFGRHVRVARADLDAYVAKCRVATGKVQTCE